MYPFQSWLGLRGSNQSIAAYHYLFLDFLALLVSYTILLNYHSLNYYFATINITMLKLYNKCIINKAFNMIVHQQVVFMGNEFCASTMRRKHSNENDGYQFKKIKAQKKPLPPTTTVVEEHQETLDFQTESIPQTDSHQNHFNLNKAFLHSSSLEQIMSTYQQNLSSLNVSNIYIVYKSLTQTLSSNSFDHKSLSDFVNNNSDFQLLTNYTLKNIQQLSVVSLLCILNTIKQLHSIQDRDHYPTLKQLIISTKSEIEKLIEQQIQENIETNFSSQTFIHPIQAAEAFYLFQYLNWSLDLIFRLVNEQVTNLSEYKIDRSKKGPVFTVYSLRMILKTSQKEHSKNAINSQYTNLAYKTQIALNKCNLSSIRLPMRITTYWELAQLQLHLRSAYKKIPILLETLMKDLELVISAEAELFSLEDLLKIIQANQWLPVTLGNKLYEQATQKVFETLSIKSKMLDGNLVVELAESFSKQSRQHKITDQQQKFLVERVENILAIGQKLKTRSIKQLLELLISKKLRVSTSKVAQYMEQQSIPNNALKMEIGCLLVEMKLQQQGVTMMIDAMAAAKSLSYIDLNAVFVFEKLIAEGFDFGTHLNSILLWVKATKANSSKIEPQRITKVLCDLANCSSFNDEQGFVYQWCHSQLLRFEVLSAQDISNLVVRFHNSPNCPNKIQAFFDSKLDQLSIPILVRLAEQVVVARQNGCKLIDYTSRLVASLIGRHIDDQDGLCKIVRVVVRLFNGTSIYHYYDQTDQVLPSVKNVLEELTSRATLPAQCYKDMPISELIGIHRFLNLLDLPNSFTRKLIFGYLQQMLPFQFEINRPLRFSYLQLAEVVCMMEDCLQQVQERFIISLLGAVLQDIATLNHQSISWQSSLHRVATLSTYKFGIKMVSNDQFDIMDSHLKSKVSQSSIATQKHQITDACLTLLEGTLNRQQEGLKMLNEVQFVEQKMEELKQSKLKVTKAHKQQFDNIMKRYLLLEISQQVRDHLDNIVACFITNDHRKKHIHQDNTINWNNLNGADTENI